MKRKATLMTLVLALAMVVCSFQASFASAPPTDATRQAIIDAHVQCIQKITDEVSAERIAINFSNEVAEGKYKLMDTAELSSKLTTDICIVDTMPLGWYGQRHIPGAICAEAGDNVNFGPFTDEQKKAMLTKLTDAKAIKSYKEYYNSKTKKWVTKKPAAKNWKGKKTRTAYKSLKPIVTYCGFVGCARSHQAAMYLAKDLKLKNVYRYPGGISAWVDANNEIDGTDVEPAPEPVPNPEQE